MSIFKDVKKLVNAMEEIVRAFNQHDRDVAKYHRLLGEQGKKRKKG